MTAPLKTFIIYASADRELRDEFERHLKPLVDLGWLSLWSDKEIAPGEQWDSTIKRNLHNADIFLMLVSVDFYNSGYIREEEFKTAISRLENGDSLIIPIIARHCSWKYFPVIKDLQVLPPDGIAVTDIEHWKTRDKAWSIVVERIGDRIETLHADRKAKIQAQKVEGQRLTDEKARREQQERIQRQQQEQARQEREAKEQAQRVQAEKRTKNS